MNLDKKTWEVVQLLGGGNPSVRWWSIRKAGGNPGWVSTSHQARKFKTRQEADRVAIGLALEYDGIRVW